MVDNPNTNNLPQDSYVRELSAQFDQSYTNLLKQLHEVFNGHRGKLKDAIGMMFGLTTLAHQLLHLPISQEIASKEPAVVAGPSFLYHP
ncbi:MAG: hypothetical protein AAF639_22210 [Chloroflexota bacterium]